MHAEPVHHTPRGQEVEIISPDWRTWFFIKGTYANRRGKLTAKHAAKRLPSSAERAGIKPVRFLQDARKAGAAVMLAFLERELWWR